MSFAFLKHCEPVWGQKRPDGKVCNGCSTRKPLDAFYVNVQSIARGGKPYHFSRCKECMIKAQTRRNRRA
jgi:hypothetical protein